MKVTVLSNISFWMKVNMIVYQNLLAYPCPAEKRIEKKHFLNHIYMAFFI